ncbi:MAG: hypothetical protein IJU19_07785 [Bacteroidales bacterium]|nr:hypothetical protein [Bacteroidales bacterium]
MKKGFIICSIATAVILCWAILFKGMHWTNGNLLSFCAALLSVISIVWGACVHLKSDKLGKSVVIYNAIVLALSAVSIWFKVAHWPGGNALFMVCLGVLIPVSIIWTAINYMKRNK